MRLNGLLLVAGVVHAVPLSAQTLANQTPVHEHAVLYDMTPSVLTRVDSAKGEVVITVGPLHIPAATPYEHHFAGAPVPFTWPVDGSVQGFRIDLLDSAGRVLPREMLHHAGVTNLDRRQLAYPLAERLFAAGRETEPVALPGSLGVPLFENQHMLLYYALTNPTDRDVNAATMRITMPWKAHGVNNPRPVLPMYFDAHPTLGAPSVFDAPPGVSVTSAEFTLPVAGHLRYLGGHLHDYGQELRLEDAESNTVLARLGADRTAQGLVRGVDRTRFLFKRNGLRLEANHRYRVVAVYDNPTCVAASGAMGILVAVFAPDDMARWPVVDASDAQYQKDLAWLLETGGPEGTEAHHHGGAAPVDTSSHGTTCQTSYGDIDQAAPTDRVLGVWGTLGGGAVSGGQLNFSGSGALHLQYNAFMLSARHDDIGCECPDNHVGATSFLIGAATRSSSLGFASLSAGVGRMRYTRFDARVDAHGQFTGGDFYPHTAATVTVVGELALRAGHDFGLGVGLTGFVNHNAFQSYAGVELNITGGKWR